MEALHLSAGFGEILQSCLETVTNLTSAQRADNNAPKSPEPSRLLQAVHFSKHFVLTYYAVITAVILIASIQHLYTRWNRQMQLQGREKIEKASPQTSSSASSTLVGDCTSTSKDGAHTEETPLLERLTALPAETSFVTRLYSRLRALLMYQPKPVIALTAPSNHMPSNDTTLLVISLFTVNVFYLFYNVPLSVVTVFAFADRAGLCFVVNLPILYVLGAKNNQPLEWLTGWSYEKVNIFHRRLGEWMIILGVLHSIGMFATWYTLIRPQGFSLAWFLSLPIIILGLGAMLSYILIWITSIGYVREKAYELFLASHIVLQIAALALLFFHAKGSRPYCGAAVAVWALDRIVSRMLLSTKKFVATLEIAEDKETVLLYCDVPLNRSKRCDIRSGWRAGQHVFLSVPGMRWHHAYQAHPFTIASPAPSSTMNGTVWPLQLIIRCKDGFSKDLLEYAEFHQHTEIYLDGPYGSSELDHAVVGAERVCLIAGGSGITVTYPLAWSSWTNGKQPSITSSRTVYYQGKKQTSEVHLQRLWSSEQRAHFWVRQSPDHGSWITMFPAHQTGLLTTPETGHYSNGVNLVSRSFETRQDDGARPDIATEVQTWLKHVNNAIVGHDQRVCMVVSGPDSLVRDVRNCAAALVREGYNIELHVEKFGW